MALRVIIVDINKYLSCTLTQVHEGEYVCRVDNRVGREEAMVKLYLQGRGEIKSSFYKIYDGRLKIETIIIV